MATEILAGWGNYPRVECEVIRPEHVRALEAALKTTEVALRGLGRSYGDQATNAGGTVVDMTGLDRYLGFDPDGGVLTCEAGVSLEQIIRDFAPQGWFPMITPGTKFVTVGGCIANDIHGKAHHVDGTFVNCVDAFTILCADGQVRTASREEHPDLFWANFGGLGLLGVILTVTLRLRRVETTYFTQKGVEVANLSALLEAFEEYDAQYPYSVAWIDPLARGARLGQGVLTVGDHAKLSDLPPKLQHNPLRVSPPSPLAVPVELPELALNPVTLRILNAVIHQVQAHGAAVAHYEKFFYPLDAIGEWNRGYGGRGFTQYQFVVPIEGGEATMRAILERIAESRFLPFLNVLKKFGKAQGLLSFPFEGYTFAIDFPIAPGLGDFLHELDAMVLDAGGRVYLGKDAFLEADMFRAMYPSHAEWMKVKAEYDPDNRFTSDIGRRLGLAS